MAIIQTGWTASKGGYGSIFGNSEGDQYFSLPISTINTVLDNGLPANCIITNISIAANLTAESSRSSVFDLNIGYGSFTKLAGTSTNKSISNCTTTTTANLNMFISGRQLTTAYGDIIFNVYTSSGGSRTCKINNVYLDVTYTIPMFTLTVTAGTGGAVSGGGTYESGKTATLTATPNTGYKFVRWSDGNTSATRTVTVTGNATYTATFEKLKYTIMVDGGSLGTASGGGEYEYGSTVMLTATPTTPGYKFANWRDGNTDNPRYVTVSGAATYYANFIPISYNISIDANGGSWTVGDNSSTCLMSDIPYKDKFLIELDGLEHPRVPLEFRDKHSSELFLLLRPLKGFEDLGEITLGDGTRYTSETFDAPYYANNYPDLYAAFGYDKYALAQHYRDDGSREGRQCVSANGVRGVYPGGYRICNLTTEEGYTVPLRCQWGDAITAAPSTNEHVEGYEFVGWTDGTNTYKPGDIITANEETVFNAVWKETKPKIKSVQMIYLDKQISEANKVPCGEGFVISVELN